MHIEIGGKRVFAATGGIPFDLLKPTVVFLHGAGLDHSFWEAYAEQFAADGYNVFAPDLPGHSNSDGPSLASIEAMADWLAETIEALGAEHASLIGHSQGALIALEFASRFKTKVRSVSLVASGLVTPVNEKLIATAISDPALAISMMLEWSSAPSSETRQDSASMTSPLAANLDVMRGNASAALAADLKACDDYQNGRNAASAIVCPAQVILGDKDRMAPKKAGVKLAECLLDAKLHVLVNCGHMVPQDAPKECLRLLQTFVHEINPTN